MSGTDALDELRDRRIDIEATGELSDRDSDASPFDSRAQQNHHVSEHECTAIQELYIDGWTIGELSFALERTEETIIRHINDNCTHE